MELHWFSPDRSVSMVVTPKSPSDYDHGLNNTLAQLRRAGLIVRPERTPEPPQEEVEETAITPFMKSMNDLFEEELDKRTHNLQDQVEALTNDNNDLRQRLAAAENGLEEKAMATAMEAVRKMLAERRVPR